MNRLKHLNKQMHQFSTLAEGPVNITQVNKYFVNVCLNKPKTLNSLDLEMIRILTPFVKNEWTKQSAVKAVLLEGSGEKAFCAGGDIKSLYDAKKTGDPAQYKVLEDFFREEFTLDYGLTQMGPIQISLLDGIVMGGGVGVSVHSPIRIATEASMFAMPEAKIGFFTDVGGGYFLSRLRSNLGYYIGLTGARLKGKELVQCGIANFYIPREKIGALKEKLQKSVDMKSNLSSISTIVSDFSEQVDINYEKEQQIQQLFKGDTFEQVYKQLESDNSEFGQKTFEILKSQCPLSVRIIFEQIKQAETQKISLKNALIRDFRLSQHFMQGIDFFEGVRTVLVDRKDTPKWQYQSPLDVPESEVKKYFTPLEEIKDLQI